MNQEVRTTERDQLHADLRRFLNIFAVVLVANAAVDAGFAVGFHSFAMVAVAGAATTALVFTLVARRLVSQGRDQPAVQFLAFGIFLVAVGTSGLVPTVYPAMCLGSAIGFAIALPYLQGRPLAVLAAACMVSGGLAALLGNVGGWFPPPSRALEIVLVISTVTSAMVLLLVQLTQFSARSHRSVSGLRRALATREEFLSIASHELRTPLTALHLQLESLERGLKKSSSEDNAQLFGKIAVARRQTDRLGRLVDRLLDVTKMQSGRLSLNAHQCDLAVLARDVAERSADDARHAGCTLLVVAERPVVGSWDSLRLEQVVTNLLSNAIKYAPQCAVTVRVEEHDGHGVLSVSDLGPGIKADDMNRIFLPFERAVPEGQYGGLGLGLYIVQQIVDAHGGTVSVQSQDPQGTTFTVRLPSGVAAPSA